MVRGRKAVEEPNAMLVTVVLSERQLSIFNNIVKLGIASQNDKETALQLETAWNFALEGARQTK